MREWFALQPRYKSEFFKKWDYITIWGQGTVGRYLKPAYQCSKGSIRLQSGVIEKLNAFLKIISLLFLLKILSIGIDKNDQQKNIWTVLQGWR